MRDHAREELLADAGECQEAVVHRELDLADDVEAVAEEEVVVPVYRAAEGVFNRQHRAIRDPELHRLESHLELVARYGFPVRIRFSRCGLRVRSGNALVRHAQLRAVHRCRGEVGDRERLRRKRLAVAAVVFDR
ncbi:hypothetical protein VIGAN_06171200 [Vigna angularis var. angularis]|uniref:Uncharacterized protein n=1 Tax=Vigna angularis var. angularis TaxID=157739 RepID=A0A0S3SCC2_PHAAN|nr:hypothetical protein VIGAN_06171200 [Vigna angularis var. angularis]